MISAAKMSEGQNSIEMSSIEVTPSVIAEIPQDPQLQQQRLQELESAFVEFAKMSEGLRPLTKRCKIKSLT